MPRLTVAEFNTPKFFGHDGVMPGGYGKYLPVRYSVNPAFCTDIDNDAWYRYAQQFIEHGGLIGRKVLELGCAFGSLVRYLRQLGVNAYGLDLSWPISQGLALWPELQSYLIVADARIWLPTQKKNSWDAIISLGFLTCFSDVDLAVMIPQLNNITNFKQVHVVDPSDDLEYYNVKTLAEWQVLPFETGTVILDGC